MKTNKFYTFRQDLEKRLKNPAFRKEWENSEVEYQLGKKLIEARIKGNLSQRELAKRMGTSQAQIARIEGMTGNPSLSFLKRLAGALGGKLQISLS